MPTILSRRAFTAGSIATLLGGATVISLPVSRIAAATTQGGTDLTSLGLPTIDVTVTANAFEGAPTELDAGRYLVTAAVASGVDEGSVAFVQPPPGMTAADFLAAIGGGGGATPEASPPEVEPEASPVEEEAFQPEILPTFIYQSVFAGGTNAVGGPGMAVIDLGPGEWILWGDGPQSAQPPVTFMVNGEMPADLPEPDADVMVTFIDFGISVEGSLTAGEHVMRLENQGAQPHFLVLEKGPDDMTNDDIAMLLDIFFGGATPAGPLPFDPDKDFQDILSTPTQSIGTVQWTTVSLTAGTYAAFCFFPTAGEGLPHALHGMYTVFKVS
jgi:hypothetical protein